MTVGRNRQLERQKEQRKFGRRVRECGEKGFAAHRLRHYLAQDATGTKMSLFSGRKKTTATHINFLRWDSLSVVYRASESGCRTDAQRRKANPRSGGLWVSRCLRRLPAAENSSSSKHFCPLPSSPSSPTSSGRAPRPSLTRTSIELVFTLFSLSKKDGRNAQILPKGDPGAHPVANPSSPTPCTFVRSPFLRLCDTDSRQGASSGGVGHQRHQCGGV